MRRGGWQGDMRYSCSFGIPGINWMVVMGISIHMLYGKVIERSAPEDSASHGKWISKGCYIAYDMIERPMNKVYNDY